MKRETMLAAAGLVLGVALLVLQFSLTIPARMATGGSLLSSVIFYFSFFTILSNFGVVLTYVASLTSWKPLAWFSRHQTRTMFAVLILIVMLVYHFVLAGIWQPVGLFKMADIGLHYVAPVLYLLWWVALTRIERLQFSGINAMMLPAFIYIVYILVRGHLTGLYPYPFVDVGVLGTKQVFINALTLYLAATVLMAVFIGIDRQLLKISQK